MSTLSASVSHLASTTWQALRFGVCFAVLACQWSLLPGQGPALAADGPDQSQDRRLAEEHGWVYNDLSKGFAEAKRTGKPLFVVIRCPP